MLWGSPVRTGLRRFGAAAARKIAWKAAAATGLAVFLPISLCLAYPSHDAPAAFYAGPQVPLGVAQPDGLAVRAGFVELASARPPQAGTWTSQALLSLLSRPWKGTYWGEQVLTRREDPGPEPGESGGSGLPSRAPQTTEVRIVVYRSGNQMRWEYSSTTPGGENTVYRVVADDGNTRWDIDQIHKVVRVSSAAVPPQVNAENLGLLRRNYNLIYRGMSHVAGRPAVVADLASKFLGLRGVRLWLDTATGLILQQQRLSRSGQIQYEMRFVSIHFGQALDPGLFRPRIPAGFSVHREPVRSWQEVLSLATRQLGSEPRLPAVLPAGFVLDGASLITTDQPLDTLFLHFTDGVVGISLFQRRLPPGTRVVIPHAQPLEVNSKRGYVCQFKETMALSWQEDDLVMVLVGDLPLNSLLTIAGSF
ncbi:MAG: hypothetical protein IMW99_03110 [Firmicutes bacterium]|nr:hypothetical protein [Bacillota bacterium]